MSVICEHAEMMLSRRYPFFGSPSSWYGINRWTLAHPRLYALIATVAISAFALGILEWSLKALALIPVVYLFIWWNFTRGPGRKLTERRVYRYESDTATSG